MSTQARRDEASLRRVSNAAHTEYFINEDRREESLGVDRDGFLYSLVTFVVIDYITGVLSAIKRRDLSSEIGFWGLVRKVLLFALVGGG